MAICPTGLSRRGGTMPETTTRRAGDDAQAVRRVLTKAGIAGATLALALAPVVPAFAGGGKSAEHSNAGHDKAKASHSSKAGHSGSDDGSAHDASGDDAAGGQSGSDDGDQGGSTAPGAGDDSD